MRKKIRTLIWISMLTGGMFLPMGFSRAGESRGYFKPVPSKEGPGYIKSASQSGWSAWWAKFQKQLRSLSN